MCWALEAIKKEENIAQKKIFVIEHLKLELSIGEIFYK